LTRDINSDLAGQFTGGSLSPVVLARVETAAGDVRMWSGIGTLDYGGEVWLGGGDFLGVSDITETADVQANGVTISLAGVASEMIDLALRQVRQGKIAEIYIGALGDVATYGTAIIDGYSLHPDLVFSRASDATVVGADGVLDTVGIDVPRFAHDPATLNLMGYLGEGPRENIAINSNTALGGTGYAAGGNTAPNQSTGLSYPLDTAAYLLKADSGVTYRYQQSFIPVVGKTYTFSVYVAYEDGRDVSTEFGAPAIEASPLNPFTVIIWGDVRTWDNIRKEPQPDGSLRIWQTRTIVSAVNRGWGVLIRDTHKAVASKLYVSGFQIEPDASFPSSYMPTVSSVFTRTADKLQILLANVSGYPGAGKAFTFVYEGWTAPGIDATQYLMAIDDGTTASLVAIARAVGSGEIYLTVIAGGEQQAFIVGPAVVGQKHIRVVAKIEAGNIAMTVWVDGENAGTFYGPDGDGGIPTGLTTLTVLDRSDGTRPGYGTCLGLWVYPWAAKKSDMRKLATGEIGFADYRKIAGGQMVGDAVRVFAGKTDVPVVEDDGASCTIGITGESALVDLERARTRRYTDQDQQAEYPGDSGFEFVTRLQEMEISWGQGLE
jgi:hypothetical protein